MNQIALYKVLDNTGCKVLSFEDYPRNLGSWRVTFMHNEYSCEVFSNRYDGYLILRSNNTNKGMRQNIINKEPVIFDDEFELSLLENWIEFSLD